jgi:hypothetical protein
LKGTEIRHADVESDSAVGGTRRWLGSTLVQESSRVRNPKAAFALSLFRRLVVSFTQVWLEECRKINPRSRATRKFQKRLLHRNGGPARLQALIFCKFPDVWRLPK